MRCQPFPEGRAASLLGFAFRRSPHTPPRMSAPTTTRVRSYYGAEARARRWSYPSTRGEAQARYATEIIYMKDTKHTIEIDVTTVLGKGAFGTVLAARDYALERPQQAWSKAIKVIDTGDLRGRSVFANECYIFEQMPVRGLANVVRYHAHGTQSDAREGYIVLDRLSGMTLDERLRADGPMSRDCALAALRQVASAVVALHACKLSPRDIKPHNIAIDEYANVTLFDFGLAVHLPGRDTLVSIATGSHMFMAPEVLHGFTHDSFAADMWCVGQVFYNMLVGVPMFSHCDTAPVLRDTNMPFRDVDCTLFPPCLLRDATCMTIFDGLLNTDAAFRWPARRLEKFLQKRGF